MQTRLQFAGDGSRCTSLTEAGRTKRMKKPGMTSTVDRFLPARRYASAGLCDSDVSVRLSVCPDVCLSHAGIVPSGAKAGS